MSQTFDDFFHTATANTPYAYQGLLVSGNNRCACGSQLISIPIGLGKIAA